MSILLDQIPKIFEQSKKTAEKILKSIEQGEKISLQTREIISPSKDNLIKDRKNKKIELLSALI